MMNLINLINLKRHVVLISLFWLSASSLYASDWNVLEDKDQVLQTDVCRATTSVVKSAIKMEFSLSFSKDGLSLPVIYLKVTKDAILTSNTILVKLSSKESQPFYLLQVGATEQDADVYWYAPKDQAKLLDLIRSADTLQLMLNPKAATPIPAVVSLAGSSAALDKTIKCLKGKDASSLVFFAALNQASQFLEQIPDVVTGEVLYQTMQVAYQAFLGGKSVAQSISDLQKSIAPLKEKESSTQKQLAVKIDTLIKSQLKMDATTSDLTALQGKLSQLNQDLTSLKENQTSAEQNFIQMKSIYDPAKSQLIPFENDLDRRESIVSDINAALQAQINDIANLQNQLANLGNQLNSVVQNINNVQFNMNNMNPNLERSRSDYNQFRSDLEFQRLLNNNFEYRQLTNTQMDKARLAESLTRDHDRALNDLRQSQQQLSQCQSVAGQDCTAANNTVQANTARERDLDQAQRRAFADASWGKSRLESITQDTRRQVEQTQNELLNRLNNLQMQYNGLVNQMNGLQSDLASIQNSQIPSMKLQLNASQSNLISLRRLSADAQNDLNISQQKLNLKRKDLNFSQIESDYSTSRKSLKQAQENVQINISATESTKKSIKIDNNTLLKLQSLVVQQSTEKDTTAAALKVIQELLAPTNSQFADLQQKLSIFQAELSRQRDIYQQEYAKLLAL